MQKTIITSQNQTKSQINSYNNLLTNKTLCHKRMRVYIVLSKLMRISFFRRISLKTKTYIRNNYLNQNQRPYHFLSIKEFMTTILNKKIYHNLTYTA